MLSREVVSLKTQSESDSQKTDNSTIPKTPTTLSQHQFFEIFLNSGKNENKTVSEICSFFYVNPVD